MSWTGIAGRLLHKPLGTADTRIFGVLSAARGAPLRHPTRTSAPSMRVSGIPDRRARMVCAGSGRRCRCRCWRPALPPARSAPARLAVALTEAVSRLPDTPRRHRRRRLRRRGPGGFRSGLRRLEHNSPRVYSDSAHRVRAREFSVQSARASLTDRMSAQTVPQEPGVTRLRFSMPKQKQLHVWISERDHALLTSHVESRDEPVGATIRRLIRQLRHGVVIAPASQPASQPAIDERSLTARSDGQPTRLTARPGRPSDAR